MNIVSLGRLTRRGWRAPGLPVTPAPATCSKCTSGTDQVRRCQACGVRPGIHLTLTSRYKNVWGGKCWVRIRKGGREV